MHPQPRVQNETKHTSVVTTGHRNNPAFPAQWFYGLLRALPGDHTCLTPSSALLIADLTPALGRQNDTTWPYAGRPRSSRALPTSIASRPAFVTTASPLCGTGRHESVDSFGLCENRNIFSFCA